MSMTFKLFRTLYGEALEATDLDHYIMERGWQEWMDGGTGGRRGEGQLANHI